MDPKGCFPMPAPYPRRRGAISLMGAVVDPHSNGASKKEGTSSVVGGIRRRTYYFRRCKKVPASTIESLPNEVLIEILVRVPVDDICQNVRFVCRNWFLLIHSEAFINAHQENSNWGLLLLNVFSITQPLFLGVRQGRIVLSKLNKKIYGPTPASCNGLILSSDLSEVHIVRFINLATKQAFSFPPSRPRGPRGGVTDCTFSMAYAAASMEYKVVRAYSFDHKHASCDILIAGVDNDWRSVEVDHLSCGAKKLLIHQDPLTTQGFMHWTWRWVGTRVLTLNAETEMFTESYVPIHPHPVDDEMAYFADEIKYNFFVTMGRRLCFFSACTDWVWEVWEMEGESGEWIKLLPNINMEAHTRRVKQEFPCDYFFLEPLGWVKYPVLLAFHCGRTCVVYNLDTDEIDYTMELPHRGRSYRGVVHRNTLEWLSSALVSPCTSIYH